LESLVIVTDQPTEKQEDARRKFLLPRADAKELKKTDSSARFLRTQPLSRLKIERYFQKPLMIVSLLRG